MTDLDKQSDKWAAFYYREGENIDEKKVRLNKMLEKLEYLISKREEWFGDNRCFF